MSIILNNKIENAINKSITPLLLLSFVLIFIASYLMLLVAPYERTMGAVQRVFYFHVGSAIACYVSFAIVFATSIFYLAKRNKIFDIVNVAAAEVGFLFCTIVLVTGMIWGQAIWGTWFRMEPRLVTFLLIWLIFLAFNLLRIFADYEQIENHSAVLGIVGAITVPIMVYSVKLMPAFKQLHPQVVDQGGLPSEMVYVMLFSMLSLLVFQFLLILLRFKLGLLENQNA